MNLCKLIVAYTLGAAGCIAQSGSVYETYRYQNESTNSSHESIFNKPFQEFNYIKTHRGIEVYRTYKYKYGATNGSHGSVISKPFPEYIIVKDKIYQTYKYEEDSTNTSRGSIFNKPFEADIIQPSVAKIKDTIKINAIENKNILKKYDGPTYDGETFYEGGGE